jgi:hypothetical protein
MLTQSEDAGCGRLLAIKLPAIELRKWPAFPYPLSQIHLLNLKWFRFQLHSQNRGA